MIFYSALPDVIEKTITPEWDFVVLACDGIWDVMTDNEVLNFVLENIAEGLDPEDICENLMTRCLAPDCQMAGLGCDNMTVVSWKTRNPFFQTTECVIFLDSSGSVVLAMCPAQVHFNGVIHLFLFC